jgi:peptidoglycan/xylan/chitin deacetylase (PgdA/CDA1 family)
MSAWRNNIKIGMIRIGSLRQRVPEKRAVILCYHSIHPTRSFGSATPELFETHLQWLKQTCDVVPLTKLLSSQCCDEPRSRVKVAITFDDGYLDNYEHAFPLLMKLGLPATFFLTVGLLEGDTQVLERFRSLRQVDQEEMETLGWQQVREMSQAGMELGAHTYSHPNLALLGHAQLEFELKTAKDIMEQRLGRKVEGFAYPFGKPRRHFNSLTVERVRNAGYQYATAVCFRGVLPRDSRWALPRFVVTGDTLEILVSKVNGAWDLLGYFQEWSPLWLARVASPKDFIA